MGKDGKPIRWGLALLWSASWGLGAGLGVAAGAWLTVVGQAGAPGVESLDAGSELLALPALVFGAVLAAHLAWQVVVASLRGARSGS
jgi:hypothetical protein